VTQTNLMCISEKVLSVLKHIKWKKVFVFSPGEEVFLLNKIKIKVKRIKKDRKKLL